MISNTFFNQKIYMVKVIMSLFVITLLMCSMAYGIETPYFGLIPDFFQGGYLSYQVPYNSYEYNSIDFYRHVFLNQKVIDYRIPDLNIQITDGICPSPATERIEPVSILDSVLGLYYYNPVAEANPQPSPFPIPWLYPSNGTYGDLGNDLVQTFGIFPDMCVGIWP